MYLVCKHIFATYRNQPVPGLGKTFEHQQAFSYVLIYGRVNVSGLNYRLKIGKVLFSSILTQLPTALFDVMENELTEARNCAERESNQKVALNPHDFRSEFSNWIFFYEEKSVA